MREELDAELSALSDALGGKGLAWLKTAERRNAGAICLTPLDPAPGPRNLRRLKAGVRRAVSFASLDPGARGVC